MSITVNLKLGVLEKAQLDLTRQMEHAADLIAQEMRGNVKGGLDVHDMPLRANKPSYAFAKMARLGHAKPLIADSQSLVTTSNYSITKVKMNHVRIGFVGQHPKANMAIGQLAYIHNYGLGKNPKREFAGVTSHALKRIMAYLNFEIRNLFK